MRLAFWWVVLLGAPSAALAQGLTATFFSGANCLQLPEAVRASRLQTSLNVANATQWALPAGVAVPYTVRMSGTYEAYTAGTHTFRVEADDGLFLIIDGVARITRGGPSGMFTVDAAVDLGVGEHVIELCHTEEGGASTFRVTVQPPAGGAFSDIPTNQLTYDPPFGGGAPSLHFDGLAQGTYLTNQLATTPGLTFLTQVLGGGYYYSRPRVVAAGAATTASTPNVLRNESFDTIEAVEVSANVPLRIRFTQPQSHVSLETGTQVSIGPYPSAVLRAYNVSGQLVAAHRLENISPSIIHRLHVLRGTTDISLITVDHGDIANDERVDGLRFEAYQVVSVPPDTTAPSVEFLEPNTSSVETSGYLRVTVRVRENSGSLQRVWASADGVPPVDLALDGTTDPLCVPPICQRYRGSVALPNGAHTVRVDAQDEAGNVGHSQVAVNFTGVTELVIVDEAGTPVTGAELFVNGAPRPYTAGAGGVVRIFPPLPLGTQLAARVRIGESNSYRSAHGEGSTQNWNFRTYLTSVGVNDDGSTALNTLTDATQVQRLVIRRDNVLFGLHLTLSAEYDLTVQEFEDVRAKLQVASDFLYNATDGQFVIEQMELFDRGVNFDSADFRLYARILRAHVNSHSGAFLGWNVIHSSMHMSRSNPGATYAHEFGHYGLDVRDEYEDDDASKRCTGMTEQGTTGPLDTFGLQASCMMWSQWRAPKLCSSHASNPHVDGLRQGGTSCWDKLVSRYGNAAFTLKTPTTRGVIPASVAPPVVAWQQVRFQVNNATLPARRCAVFTQRFVDEAGAPVVGATTWLRGPGVSLAMGLTDMDGSVSVAGAHVGDVLRATLVRPTSALPSGTWTGPAGAPWSASEPASFEGELVLTEANCPRE